jgi:hypothetical protein
MHGDVLCDAPYGDCDTLRVMVIHHVFLFLEFGPPLMYVDILCAAPYGDGDTHRVMVIHPVFF